MMQKILHALKDVPPVLFIIMAIVVIDTAIVLLLPFPSQLSGDFPVYHHAALGLLDGNFFSDVLYIAPMWSVVLALFYGIFGASLGTLMLVQVFLHTMIALLVYRIARMFVTRRASLFAVILIALWPSFILQLFEAGSGMFLFVTLLLVSVYLLIRFMRNDTLFFIALSGMTLGFAALTDPIATYLPIVFGVWLIVCNIRSPNLSVSKLCAGLVLFFVFFSLVVAPWSYRNIKVFDGAKNAPLIVKGEENVLKPTELRLILYPFTHPRISELGLGLKKMFVTPYLISTIDRETDISYMHALGEIVHGRDPGLSTREQVILVTKVVFTLMHLFLLATAFIGIFIWNKKNFFNLLVLSFVIYVTIAAIGFGSLWNDNFQSISPLSNFLFPTIPFLFIVASVALDSFVIRKRYARML